MYARGNPSCVATGPWTQTHGTVRSSAEHAAAAESVKQTMIAIERRQGMAGPGIQLNHRRRFWHGELANLVVQAPACMCGHCGRTAKTCGRVGRNTNMCGPRWPHRKHVRPALAAPQTCAAALAAIQTRAAAFAATQILAAGTATPQSFAAGTATPQSTAAGTATPQSFAAGTAAPQALAAATAAAQISGCPTGRRLIDTNITRRGGLVRTSRFGAKGLP